VIPAAELVERMMAQLVETLGKVPATQPAVAQARL